MKDVHIVIRLNGDIQIEWDPKGKDPNICCIKEEQELLEGLQKFGLILSNKSISCKMLGVPEHPMFICKAIGKSKTLSKICENYHES